MSHEAEEILPALVMLAERVCEVHAGQQDRSAFEENALKLLMRLGERIETLTRHFSAEIERVDRHVIKVSKNQVEVGERLTALTKEVHQMDVSGLDNIAKIMTDAATSLNASATAILAKTDTSKADQDQLNAALGTLSTAAQAVATAAKAVADAVTPPVV